MSDIDFGPLVLFYIEAVLAIFVFGGSFFYFLMWLLFLRRYKHRRIFVRFMTFVAIFVVGGLLAEITVKTIESIQVYFSRQKREIFEEQMQNDYRLVSLTRDGNSISIKYTVPRYDKYELSVYGVPRLSDEKTNFDTKNAIVEDYLYDVSLKKGINEYTTKIDNEQLSGYEYLDFDFEVAPIKPTKRYEDTHWGIRLFAPTLSSLDEGAHYRSSSSNYCYNIMKYCPCKEESLLHLKL